MRSHRARLALITSAVAGIVLALVFVGIGMFFKQREDRAVDRSLTASLSEVTQDIKKGQSADLDQIHNAHPSQSFAIYAKDGRLIQKVGSIPVGPWAGSGETNLDGRHLIYRSAQIKDYLFVGVVDWASAQERMDRLSVTLLLLWFFVVGIVALVSWYAAVATFRPLFHLTEQAAQVSGGDLSFRLGTEDKAEYGEFTKQLNHLLERIEETATREEQFASDAAHELRTPLAIIRGKIESTLLKPRTNPEYETAMHSLLPEVDRLTGIVEMLLRSARSRNEAAPVTELSSIVEESAARWLDQFELKHIHLEVEAETAYAAIWSEEVQCLVDNFLNNALKVSPSGSNCKVVLENVDGSAVLRVEDEGPGIPENLLNHVFERFTRGESSRNRASGGFGIGLSVCKNIVDSRGGTITAENLRKGAEFKVELKAAR
jgi:signal transduction histidine kinase